LLLTEGGCGVGQLRWHLGSLRCHAYVRSYANDRTTCILGRHPSGLRSLAFSA
jgi:hypothetical protein